MVTTDCERCCFFKQDDQGKGCAINQLCTVEDGQIFAPGYCRMCRSHKWVKQQDSTNLRVLCRRIMEERVLKFDMLILFDEARHNITDLERTLNSDWYIKYIQKIVIVDVTGFGDRQNLALRYLKSREHSVITVVDSSVAHESVHQQEETIRRVSIKVTAPFFLVIPAGQKFNNFDLFATRVQYTLSRVIHWSFPLIAGTTTVIPQKLHYGLFITAPYRALMKSPEAESFTQQLRKGEIETKMGLSWFCSDIGH